MTDRNMRKSALVTGANGYIGRAVAEAFCDAGWKTFGLVRRAEDAAGLARREIRPVVGSPADPSFLERVGGEVFDVVVSNTEDRSDPAGHFGRVRSLLDEVGSIGRRAGVRPLAMFTSGCKDYGRMAERHGDPGLRPHTERDPLAPPRSLEPRARFGAALLAARGAPYDATVLRPTIVYGRSSSLYGPLFDLAEAGGGVLRMVGDPDAVMHSVHVDDCARAYVALAEHPDRGRVAGRPFNISGERYETAREIGEALARSYGSTLEFAAADGEVSPSSVHGLASFSQWVGSDALRSLTGWRDRKPRFAADIDGYRLAYEARRARPRPVLAASELEP